MRVYINMKKLMFGVVALAVVVLSTACSSLDQAMQMAKIDKPTVSMSDARITGISFDQARLEFTLDVNNPNPIPVQFAGFDYNFLVNGYQLLAGEQRDGVKVAANQTSQVKLPLVLKFADIFELVKGLSDSQTLDYAIKTDALLDLPIMGMVRVPAEKTGQVPVPRIPKISLDGIKIKKLGFTGADVEIGLNLDNPNAFDIDIRNLGYDLVVNGQRWLQSQGKDTISLAKSGSSQVKVPLHLSFLDMGRTLANLLTQQSPLEYQLVGNMNMDTSLPMLKDIALPFRQEGSVSPLRE